VTNPIAISVKGISKRYSRTDASTWAFLQAIRNSLRGINRRLWGKAAVTPAQVDDAFWALRDINFEVKRGQRIGIIGRNGAGKSTLLKILSRLVYPTEGEVRIRGRVTSLLEVGTGFNMSMSGRENIYLNAALHGLEKKKIDDIFDTIVEFSGVGEFLNMPVKHYSSGMYMRLAFSVAAHLDPDILLMDEVLAVGDLSFQQKCLQRVENLASEGRTIIFVSHSMGDIARFCDQVIWIDGGKIRFFGETIEGIKQFQAEMNPHQHGSAESRTDRTGSGLVRFTNLRIIDETFRPCPNVSTGQPVGFVLSYEFTRPLLRKPFDVFVFIAVENERRQRIFSLPSEVLSVDLTDIGEKKQFICMLKRLPLVPGIYYLTISLLIDRQLVDKVTDVVQMVVTEGDYYGTGRLPLNSFGAVCVDFDWQLLSKQQIYS